jgi:hypothetical protein
MPMMVPRRTAIRGAILASLIAIEVGCSHAKSPDQPPPITYTVGFASGSEGYKDGCEYDVFQVWQDGEIGAGIFKLIPDQMPSPPTGQRGKLLPIRVMDLPAEGASLSGDLSGFGKRRIMDSSANRSLMVDVVYHATTYDAALKRMTQLGCL